jgi:pimeloyl-ACP methyl ester carboxylesterase
MHTLMLLALLQPAAPTAKVEYLFAKVAPTNTPGRSKGQERAIVLIHGLGLFPLNKDKVITPALRTWQKSESILVKELAKQADVYALAYSQTAAVEKVHEETKLAKRIKSLKDDGYKEIILVGHSAGGLVARHFVEDHRDSPVTKVIQVCAPNTGSSLAAFKAAREGQIAYLASLSITARTAILLKRKETTIPAGVEFACVICSLRLGTDGVVSTKAQWSEDLQKQGIPAHLLHSPHWDVMKTRSGAEFVSKVIRDAQPRWKDEQVKAARKKYLGWLGS